MSRPEAILVLDDDPNIGRLVCELAKANGYENVIFFVDGFDALRHIVHNPVDLIFLDVEMPTVDGWLICEILHNVGRWKEVPVVFQSALRGKENIQKGINLGAHSYMEKPFSPDKIKAVLNSIFCDEVPITGATPGVTALVEEVSATLKKTFNLMLGSQTSILDARPLVDHSLRSKWDFAAVINATGGASIEVAFGWDRGLATDVAMALMQRTQKDLDDELICDGMQEILNMVLGSALRTIGKKYLVRLGLPTGLQDGPIPYNHQAPHRYRLDAKSGDWIFPVVVTLVPAQESSFPSH